MRYVLVFGILGIIIGCSSQSARERCLDRGGTWDQAHQRCVEQQPAVGHPGIPLTEQDSTRYYSYKIHYPAIIRSDSLLRQATRAFAAEHKQRFLALFQRDTMPRRASYPWDFRLDFRVQDSTESFVSILGSGYAFSGGAHGNHFYRTLTLDRRSHRLLQLSDIITDSTALEPVSKYVRPKLIEQLLKQSDTAQGDPRAIANYKKRIRQWVREGTVPNLKNYRHFWLSKPVNGHPTGFTFLFPPYQVAPYSAGEQQVFVPATVFGDGLRIRYRDWFGM